ncbi:MAG: glycoside hydrolase family 95 protein [Ruminococcaceae bacterium]|nr:glycoside hydrolase family 95 protein [Oscillospiraceae bacterium]
MKHKLTMRYPTAWHGDMWREGAPIGNGLIGGMVYGGIYKENILINHAMLWRGGNEMELPDVSYIIPEIRRLLDEHKVVEADTMLADELRKKGYVGEIMEPSPLADIVIETPSKELFSHYRREIDMERALVTVSWDENGTSYKRESFISRCDDRIYTRYSCENGKIDTKIAVKLHDTETLGNVVIPQIENFSKGSCSFFAAYNESVYKAGDFGIVCKIFADGDISNDGEYVCVSGASDILVVAEAFIERARSEAFSEIEQSLSRDFDFCEELEKHTSIHAPLFHAVDFSISDTERTNEELLLESFEESSSNELMEKLYAYGRYLFLCSTDERGTLPCHLTGLFNGTYQTMWAFNMYNVNFEMIYWQALTGNLPEFLRLALDYTEEMVPQFRENAKKMFGCRGIWINSVNTPDTGLCKCLANHIVNWTGGAAWLSQHYYDYFRFTEDITYLKEHAMPFMYEAALFYEDFAVENERGYYDLYPSVSPENAPANILRDTGNFNIETSKNATMEFSLLKELLTNLLEASRITGLYQEKTETWKKMLSKIPPYMINEDGAVREWMDPYYEDNYHHRHHSHVYPVFPGCEITRDDPLYPAFERAEDLRLKYGLSDQSSWSMVFMAGIAARMGRSEFALKLLDTIGRVCLMNNFLTVCNDWRRMGPIACMDLREAPFQIDGNIGITGVINEMLLQSQASTFEESRIVILPALPDKWEKGSIKGLLTRGNIKCDIVWDESGGAAILKSSTKKRVSLTLGDGYVFSDGSAMFKTEINGELKISFCRKR